MEFGKRHDTTHTTDLDLFLPTSGDRPSYGAMVERRDGPSWLRDDDDDRRTTTCYGLATGKLV